MFRSSLLLFLLIIIISSIGVRAQSNFSKTYRALGLDWSFGTNIHCFDDNYLLTLSEYPSASSVPNSVRYLTIDISGNIVNDRLIDDFESHTYPVKSNGTLLDSDRIYSLLFNREQGRPQSFGLLTMNLIEDTISYRDYAHISTTAGYSLVKGQGDTLIIFADEVDGADTSKWVASLTFYDTGTGEDTTISYRGDYGYPQPGEIKTLANGEILMAFGARDYSSQPPGEERGILQKISANGKLLWSKPIYPGRTFDFQPTILPLPNGDIAYGWTKDSFSLSRPPRFYDTDPVAIFFLDSLGEFKSRTMLGPVQGQLNNLELLPGGDILGMGWKGMIVEPGVPGRVGWVFRLSPNGEKIWERLITYPGSTSTYLSFYDAVETPSGDILLAGVRDIEEFNYGSWLVKLGADGCYDPDDCGGVKDTIVIYEEVVDIKTPEVIEVGLDIFPNPTKERFTVQLPSGHETAGSKSLSLFDVSGREVYRQSYVSGEQLTISVDDKWSAGVYLVKLETPLGVAQGKVIIR
ncbi:T9SS type A sorting domain-containing protein [Neolewinella agarilytica]|uniref:Por secretion system C-terminal sorting domain-containing protein n=1 Tax=Neolewinella agarilytica TaxID=478744 RepID=A0A1H9G7T8_9BACT|nr:T9SS type A sorting domain-containing protein [Neolewinella agarilytica]SEQ46139.1 Por secretion system C-terminal sorting domain-containing protein [Neolewinella agarilytica]